MAFEILAQEKVWLDKARYADAECMFHEKLSKVNKYESSIFCSKDGKSSEKVKAIIDLKNAFEKLDARVEVLEEKSSNEMSNTAYKLTDESTLTDTRESINFKIQKFEELKMVKSESINVSQCENCSLCDKITKCHDNNDINKLLSNVEQWDIKHENQYKKINKFECLICFFKTNKFIDWKLHIMSISHMADCHKIKDLYSYVCSSGKCKLLLYGSKKCLTDHRVKHLDLSSIIGVPILMAEVMQRFITKQQKSLYFCSHCRKYAETPIHSTILRNIKRPVKYYCKYCKVHFYSSPEMIDYHSLSVEHMTLKCFDTLCPEPKMNSKKIKSSEKSNKNEEENLLPTVDNQTTILDGYRYCKLCSTSVYWDIKNIISHLSVCEYQNNLTIPNDTTMIEFKCDVCYFSSKKFGKYKKHIISIGHLTKCNDSSKYFSYFCDVCCTFIYASKTAIDNHQQQIHDDNNTVKLPMLSTFMAKTIDLNRVKPKHYFGDSKSEDEQSNNAIHFCNACKIVFHTPVDYNMHLITCEHIVMALLMSMFEKNKKRLATTKKTKTVTPNVQSIPLFQNSNDTEVDSNHIQDVQVNKNSVDEDADSTILLDQKSQEIPANFYPKELDFSVHNSNSESDDTIELNSSHKKQSQRYTKYFTHKMNILNLLKQYKDYITKTLSYYCNVCDFLTEERYDWDSHNTTEHSSPTDLPIIHCSTCSIIVFGESYEEHVSKNEHSIILEFVQSLDSMKSTELVNLVDTCTSPTLDETFMNPDKNDLLNLNESDNTEAGILDCENSKNNICNMKKECSSKSKDHQIISNTLLLDKSNDTNKHKSIEAVKCIPNEIASEYNISSNILPTTIPCQQNEDMNMKKEMNFVDWSTFTDDLDVPNPVGIKTPDKMPERKLQHDVELTCGETTSSLDPVTNLKNKKAWKLDEDEVYGEYVTQRLKNITNTQVKQDLLLEIDYLFCIKIKQFQQKNA